MTAEVAVMNKGGIALAADSMQSFPGSSFSGAQKLFTLSDEQPIAIMVYGCATFGGDPWGENVIPAFKDENKGRLHATIADCTELFEVFVRRYPPPPDERKAAQLHYFVEAILDEVESVAGELFDFEPRCYKEGLDGALEAALEQHLARYRKGATVLGTKAVDEISHWGSAVISRSLARDWITADRRIRRKCRDLVSIRLAGAESSNVCSGIVIAGYGTKQNAPALCALNIEGYLGPILKVCKSTQKDMKNESTGQIAPFAQRDMVDAFMLGMDQGLLRFSRYTFSKWASLALDASNVSLEKKAMDLVNRTAAEFEGEINRFGAKTYNSDVMKRVTSLSPWQLPELAHSLVFMSVMRHKYSFVQPSVGGPIDVAFMSRASPVVDLRLGART